MAASPLVTIDRSTINNNDAGNGGGISRNRGSITVTNSTISGNTSNTAPGGGIYDAGGYVLPLLLVNCTVADNTASTAQTPGGGIFNNGITGGKETELANTIVAGNHADTHVDYEGTLFSQGYNLIGDANGVIVDGGVSNSTGDQIGVANPHLGPLANNGGGFRYTHALLAGSPAIDAGNPAASDGSGFHCQPTDRDRHRAPRRRRRQRHRALRHRRIRGRGRADHPDADRDQDGHAHLHAHTDVDAPRDRDPHRDADRDRDAGCRPRRRRRARRSATTASTTTATRSSIAPIRLALPTGGGLGIGDTVKGKALVKCAGALQKAGAKLEAKRLARLQKCVDAAFACAQVKNGDSACFAKARGGCDKAFAALAADEATFAANVTKKCGAPAVAAADLTEIHGLGYTTQGATCTGLGAATPTDAASVAACVARAHACRADAALGVEAPRAAEMLALVGHQASELPCLPSGSGAGAGLGDAKTGKLASKCEQAAKKAGAKLVGTELKTAQKCATAVLSCIQTKPNDAKCLPKAHTSCTKGFAKLTDGTKGIDAKLAAAVDKACAATGLTLADVLDANGVGFGALAAACTPTGVDVTTGVPNLAQCLATYHECRAGELLEAELPRVRELLSLVGVTLP